MKPKSFLQKKSKDQIETLKAIFRPEASAIQKSEPSFILAIIRTEIEGQELFYTPGTPPSDGIFSRGENFHPKTHKALFQREDDFSNPLSYVPSGPTSEEAARLKNLKALYGERFSQHSEEQISLLAEFLLASVKFDSQMSNVLAKRARTLRIGTRIIEDSALDSECQTVMQYQQQATYLLNQKLKWLFIHQQLKNQLHICIERT